MFNFYYLINGNKYLCSQINARYKVLDSNVIYLCPFTILSGAVWNTNNGFNNLVVNNMLYNPTNNTQKTLILTGNNPINVRWDNSIKPTFSTHHSFNKNFQVGDYYTCLLQGDYVYTKSASQLNINGLQFLNLSTQINITVILPASEQWTINSSDLMNKLFIIKGAQIDTNDLFYISSIQPTLNEQLPKIESYTITLTNLNLEYSATGKEILQMINFSMIGDNYPYPNYNPTTNTIELDQTRLTTAIGATDFEVLTNSAQLFNSISLYGGIADQYQVNPLQKLLVWTPTVPTTPPLELTGSGVNAYFIWENAKPVFHEVFNSYTEWVSALNNVFGSRNYIGGLTQDTNIQNTNQLTTENNNQYYTYYNPNWLWSGNNSTYNTYSNYALSKEITFNSNYAINDILNLNSVINENIYQFSPSFKESTQFQISNIPLIGTVWRGISLGCDPTFYVNNYSLNDITQSFILITPIHQYLTALSAVSDTNGPISLDFFSFNQNENVKGAKVNVCNLQFKITDRFQDDNLKIPNYTLTAQDKLYGNDPANGIYNTLFLGQTTYPDGTLLPFATVGLSGSSKAYAPSPQAQTKGFYIGGFKQQSIGLTQERLNFYSNLTSAITPIPIYQNIFNTSSLMRNNPCLWTDGLSFSIYTDDILDNLEITWPNKLVSSYLTTLPTQTTNNTYTNPITTLTYSGNLDNVVELPKQSNSYWVKYTKGLPTGTYTVPLTFTFSSNNWYHTGDKNNNQERVSFGELFKGYQSDLIDYYSNQGVDIGTGTAGVNFIFPSGSINYDWTFKEQTNNYDVKLDLSFINTNSALQQQQTFTFKIPCYAIGLKNYLFPNNFINKVSMIGDNYQTNINSNSGNSPSFTNSNTYLISDIGNKNLEKLVLLNQVPNLNENDIYNSLNYSPVMNSLLNNNKINMWTAGACTPQVDTITGGFTDMQYYVYPDSFLFECYYNTQSLSIFTNCYWTSNLSNYGASSEEWNVSGNYLMLGGNTMSNGNGIGFIGNNASSYSNQLSGYWEVGQVYSDSLQNEPYFVLTITVGYTKEYPDSLYFDFELTFENNLGDFPNNKLQITKAFYTSAVLNINNWNSQSFNGGAFSSSGSIYNNGQNGYTTATLPYKICETYLTATISFPEKNE